MKRLPQHLAQVMLMTEPLWSLDDVLAATGGSSLGNCPKQFGSVAIDSRTLEAGALFVAIKGERLDGHDYVAKAFASGAGGAIVSQDIDLPDEQGCLIRVGDTLEALNALARAARARSSAKIIAVTGSVGKTGTKEALRLALQEAGPTHASQKSYNNHWGVPLTLANLAHKSSFGVFEIGMNHAGEIAALVDLVRPHIAIITTVEPVHLEFFASVEKIAEAKAEIFDGLTEGGTAVLNRDNEHFALLKKRAEECGAAKILDFGTDKEAYAHVREMALNADGSDVDALIGGRELRYRIGAPGRHHVLNSLAVLAACDAAGVDLATSAAALAGQRAQKGRGERFVAPLGAGEVALIDESYNANPASMRAALDAMAQTPREQFGRRIAVLGDMLELGAKSAQLHQTLAGAVDAAGVDVVFACGPMMAQLFEALPTRIKGGYAKSSDALAPLVVDALKAGDVVMIKGSLGSRMEPIVAALKHNLDLHASARAGAKK